MEENQIKELHKKSKEDCLKTFKSFDRVFYSEKLNKEYEQKLKRHLDSEYKEVQRAYKRLVVNIFHFQKTYSITIP